MPLVVKDRVRETSTTAGSGTFTLAGAVTGYQSFSAIGNGNTTYYTIYLQGGNEWEVGIGTYTASGTTLSRDTVLASSNGGSAVNFSAGVKDVFVTYPAGRSVYYDTATNVTLNALTLSGGTANGVPYLNGSKVVTTGSAMSFNGSKLTLGTLGSTGRLFELYGSETLFDGAGPFELIIGDGGVAYMSLATTDNATALKIRNYSGNSDIAVFERTTGNVGIGTPTPSDILHLNRSSTTAVVQYITNTGGEARIGVENSAGTGILSGAGAYDTAIRTASGTGISFGIGYSAPAMRLNPSGNLGLGVTPSAWASGQVAIELGGNVGNLAFNSAGATREGYLYWNSFYNGTNTLYKANGFAIAYGGNNGEHRWFNAPSGTAGNTISFTQAMTLNASGRLGVGETNPSTVLHVKSSGNPTITLSGSDGAYTSIFSMVAAGGGSSKINANGGTNTLILQTNSNDYVFVNSSGNVGFGTAPSAWSGVQPVALQTDGGATIYSYGTDNVVFGHNVFFNGTGGFSDKYIRNGFASKYYQINGAHSWYSAASGTAGNPISFTQAMTLSASAELNIDSGTGGGRLTFQPGATQNQILSTTTGFGAYNILRYVAAQHQWLDAASTQAMTLNASGYLGIGATNPTAIVEAWGNTTGFYAGGAYVMRDANATSNAIALGHASHIIGGGGSTNAALWNYANGYFAFGTNNTERARIDSSGTLILRQSSNAANTSVSFNTTVQNALTLDSSGRLGIGTNSPGQKLEVQDGFIATYDATNTLGAGYSVRFYSNGGTAGAKAEMARVGGVQETGASSNNGALVFATRLSGTVDERMRLDSSGNLGLAVQPSLWGANRQAIQIGGTNGGYVTADYGLAIASNYAYTTADKFVGNGYAPLYFMSSNNGQHQWYISGNNVSGANANWTPTQAMTLDASGNLGIGTTNPGVKLDVAGVVRGTFNSSWPDGSGSHGFEFRNAGTTTKALVGGVDGSRGAYIQAVNFGTAYTDLMLQPNGGNLGLGVTPSPWGSSRRALQIGSQSAINNTGNNTQLTNNYYADSADNPKYIGVGFAQRYVQDSTGAHAWQIASSWNGTGSDAISFTQAMTLDELGNLGIGTTAPKKRLTVNDASSSSTTPGTNPVVWVGGGNVTLNTLSEIGFTYGSNSWVESNVPATVGFQLTSTSGYGKGALTFCTRDVTTDTAPTERARITSGGDLLVGTTSNTYSARLVAIGSGNGFFELGQATSSTLFQSNGQDFYLNLKGTGNIVFRNGASDTERARITSVGGFETRPAANGHAVFNEDSVDADFRVESDSNTHALFVDAGNNAVGVSTSTPASGVAGYDGLIGLGLRGQILSAYNDSVAAAGYIDITVASGGGAFNGFLTVSNVYTANAAVRTQVTYSIFGRGTNAFSAQLIATADGSTSGAALSISNPSNGVIRITNDYTQTTSLSAVFMGTTGA